ncbi:MAG: UPF0182 family protein [Gemmatimonadota bacterium]|nr:UPF0182 family protein [Gemmatimonadota bacterium]
MPRLPRRAKRFLFAALASFAVVFIAIPWLAGFVTDWLWFKEVGFEAVFATSLVWRIGLFCLGGGMAFAFFFENTRLAAGSGTHLPVLYLNRQTGVQVDVAAIFKKILRPVSAVLAFVMAIETASLWMEFLKAAHGASFGASDPIFGRDISFYVFKLPAISDVLTMVDTLVVFSFIAAVILYSMRGEVEYRLRRVTASPAASRHLAALVVLWFVLRAIGLWIVDTSNLLFSTTGPLVGASYTDVHVALPGIRITAVVALIAAAMVIYGLIRGKAAKYAIAGTVLHIASSFLLVGVIPGLYQKLVVSANELDRERPYLQDHIVATRKAWGLDGIEEKDLSGEVRLTMEDIKNNAATVDNVRLWERDLLKQTFGQLQEIRTYYDFVSVDDDRYTIDGRYRQVHVAAREMNSASLPTRTFINERLTFTHGMGVTMAPVNEVTSEGLPVLFIKDLPPASSINVKLTRPQLYYGELTNDYVFVGTGQKEFDYPSGETNIYGRYAGKGGIPVGSLARKLLYAFQLGSLKILLSDDIKGAARILYRRNIAARAATALPFLTFDGDPYLVVTDDGRLQWILDAYTKAENYPYAQKLSDGTSYMRNSVKVVIDAYDGTVEPFVTDPSDPVIVTYERIFGRIFKPMSEMPADIRRHIRYPGDLFRIQTNLHATYHMLEPDAFYHREDQWQIPTTDNTNSPENPFMRHIVMRLPGEKNPEFIYMTPFTPRGKDNLAAWMVARMDGDNYGKLSVYRFPKQSLVYGPRQIVNRINQDTDISRQITLWDQKGSEVIRGELLVIPIEESLIYVQPIYLRAQGGSIPELKRVVVAHENRVVMGETLDEGLNALFGNGAPPLAKEKTEDSTSAVGGPIASVVGGGVPEQPVSGGASAPSAPLLRSAQDHYDRAIAAQRAGDWATYGREIQALGAAIRSLQGAKR